MKRSITCILILFTIIFFSIPSSSQVNKIKFGEVQKKEGGLFAMFRLLELDSNYYYIHSTPNGHDVILRYNLSHQLMSTTEVEETLKRSDISFRNLFHSGGDQFAYFFDGKKTKEDKTWRIYVSTFDRGKLGKVKEIFNQTYPLPYEFRNLYYQANIHSTTSFGANGASRSLDEVPEFVQSPDRSKTAFYVNFDTPQNNKSFSVAIAVFDEHQQLIWERFHTVENVDAKTFVSRFTISNEGEVLMLMRSGKKSSGNKDERAGTFLLKADKDQVTYLPIELFSDYNIDDVQILPPDHTGGPSSLAGFYSNADESKKLEGVFVANVSLTDHKITPKLYPFPKSVGLAVNTKGQIKKNSGISRSFQLDHKIRFNDGSFAFIAERRYSYPVTKTSGTTMKTYTMYHAGEILLPFFTPDGELDTITVIDKEYDAEEWEWGSESYTYAFYQDKLHLLYNTVLASEDKKELREEGIKGNLFTNEAIIDHSGKILSEETIMTNKDYDLLFIPFICDFENDKWLIGTMSLNKYSFGILRLK
jgi:hypothetical protein